MLELNDKIAIVTGSARGIGRGITSKMAEYGATVVVSDLDIRNVRNTVAELQSEHSEATFGAHEVDITRVDSVKALVNYTVESFGRIDILVNNAAIFGAPGYETRPYHPHEDDWDQIYAVNVKGVAKMSDAVMEFMKLRRYGKILNIASTAGRQSDPEAPAYCASKTGVISLTQAYALGLAPYNINVNAICPRPTWTAMMERIVDRHIHLDESQSGLTPRERFDRYIQAGKMRVPLGREMMPEDMGNLAVYLASELSRNITGQAINVDGGFRLN